MASLWKTPASDAKMFDSRENVPVTLEVAYWYCREAGMFFGQGLSTKHPTTACAFSVSTRSYVGSKLVSDLYIKKITRASTASQHQALI